jgi:hypothetical protein
MPVAKERNNKRRLFAQFLRAILEMRITTLKKKSSTKKFEKVP